MALALAFLTKQGLIMKNPILVTLCCIHLLGTLFAPLAAEEPLPAGVTMEQFQEKVSRKAEQNALEQEAFDEALEEKIPVMPVNPNPCNDSVKVMEINKAEGRFTNYITSHTGAWHFPIAVSGSGNHLVLEDGSGWLVCECDSQKTLDWVSTDTILVTLAPWYSWYDYVLINCRSGARVRVTFEETPTYLNAYTFWIKKIDHGDGRILLNDGTLWVTAPFSYSTMKSWQVGQKIIIGINDRLFSRSYANFIVNEDAKEYVKAQCLY